ncbi:radical SAM protein [Lewinella sp. W8]|uniref:radical SAM protein n=1 Tax=Lewinella sp. W8 TaxID=2528208 RepID=UPI0015642057
MDNGLQERAGFLSARIVHLHPSRFCNLACAHCYSSSGPQHRDHLELDKILCGLALLREEGYQVLSLSGGEPLLYRHFTELVKEASALGYRINLISNGAPVKGRLLEVLCEYVHLATISLDGAPDLHNELRGNPKAFDMAQRAIQNLRDHDRPVGIAYCVSQPSLIDMPWAVNYAEAMGAQLVQFHPFADTGRGKEIDQRLGLSPLDLARMYAVAKILQDPEGPGIHVDLVPRHQALAAKGDYKILGLDQATDVPLADLANPLIIDERGSVVPFAYGLPRHYTIGELGENFASAVAAYKAEGWRATRTLIDQSFTALGEADQDLVDWFFWIENCTKATVAA